MKKSEVLFLAIGDLENARLEATEMPGPGSCWSPPSLPRPCCWWAAPRRHTPAFT